MSDPIRQAVIWLNDPLNWTNPGGILDRLGEHLLITAGALGVACLVAWPVGIWLGHRRVGGSAIVVVSNVTLAIPALATLTILPLSPIGFGRPPVIIALAIFAVPPLLATAHTGVHEVDPQVRDAAVGMGMSARQLLLRVEIPLAVPYLAAGLRTAAVQVVATAALAALVDGGGLGQFIAVGFGLGLATGAGQVLAGGLLVATLAVLVDGLLAAVQRAVAPRHLRRSRRRIRVADR